MLICISVTALLLLHPGFEALNASANEQFHAGQLDRAEQTERQALQAARAEKGPNHPAAAVVMRNLAAIEHARGNDAAAEALARTSISIIQQAFGPADPLLVPSLNTLAEIEIARQRYHQAAAILKRAIRIGARDPEVHYSTSLQNLAALDQMQGRFDQAEKLYFQALRDPPALIWPRSRIDPRQRPQHLRSGSSQRQIGAAFKSNLENARR